MEIQGNMHLFKYDNALGTLSILCIQRIYKPHLNNDISSARITVELQVLHGANSAGKV